MKIKTVHYSALINLGNYNNERIGFTADINEDENLETVVNDLRAQVRLCGGVQASEMYDEIYKRESELRSLRKKVKEATAQWNAIAEFLRTQGIKNDAVDMPMFTNLLPEVTQESVTDGELVESEDSF